MNQTSTVIEEHDEKVQLFLSCRKLKNMDVFSLTDPQVTLYIERRGQYAYFNQTEMIKDNLDPNFTKTFLLDFVFEIKQKLKFEVFNVNDNGKNDLVGCVETTLSEIIGAKNMTAVYNIENRGKVHGKLAIRAEKVDENHSSVEMGIEGKSLKNTKGWFGKSSPVLKLSRVVEDSGFVSVYESEVIKKNLNPSWKPFEIKVCNLCNGDYMRPIKAEVFSRSGFKDSLIGECQFTVDELVSQKKKEFTLFNYKKNKNGGTLRFDKFKIHERPVFLDYLRGGTQLAVMVAVDFTESNGNPTSLDSLHAMKYDGTLNDYQRAIMSVCDILLHYDSDKKVPMFGFGGIPKFSTFTKSSVTHCFSMTGDPTNPWAHGLEGIMKVYSNALDNVKLSGPTLFAPILQTAMNIALQNKKEGSQEYTILLILTDGEIFDMEPTINCLINSAKLPLSVIIVGVGQADFKNMIILDGDDGLCNSDGVKAERDLVQFVPFRDFQESPKLLAKQVLEEIPTQVVEYYTSMNIMPKPAQYIDVGQLLRGDTLDDRAMREIQGEGGGRQNINNMFAVPLTDANAAHYSNINFPGNKVCDQKQQIQQEARYGNLCARKGSISLDFEKNLGQPNQFAVGKSPWIRDLKYNGK